MKTRWVVAVALAMAVLPIAPATAQAPRDQHPAARCHTKACVERVRKKRAIHRTHPFCNSWSCVRRVNRKRARRMGVRGIALLMLQRRGAADQFPCLDALWARESGWSPVAHNSRSGAHGIPQALPGSKMGPGWESNPVVQIRWGIGYIYGRYGSPCAANAFQLAHRWY